MIKNIQNLTQNVFHHCFACGARAIYKVTFDQQDDITFAKYVCEEDGCGGLQFLDIASTEEIHNHSDEVFI